MTMWHLSEWQTMSPVDKWTDGNESGERSSRLLVVQLLRVFCDSSEGSASLRRVQLLLGRFLGGADLLSWRN